MGVYANNTFNVDVPMTEIGQIITEFHDVINSRGYGWQAEWDEETPETLGRIITDLYGCEDLDGWDVSIDGTVMQLSGHTFGKVNSDGETLDAILAEHGAVGIIHGECEGEFFMTEYTGTELLYHAGRVTYPTYKGGRY